MLDITRRRRLRVTHPDPLDLLRWAAGEPDRALARHVESCLGCTSEIVELRAAMAGLSASPAHAVPAGADCLDDHAVAALAEGGTGLSAHERAAFVRHLADCARCGAAVAGVMTALADDSVTAEVRALEPDHGRRWPHVAAAAAAIGLLLVLVQPRPGPEEATIHRARSAATAPAPELVAPLGRTGDADVLRWRSVAGADVYRVTLYDSQGAVLHESIVGDTVARLPSTLPLRPDRPYYWTVAARTGWDRWAVAELAEFTLPGPAR